MKYKPKTGYTGEVYVAHQLITIYHNDKNHMKAF